MTLEILICTIDYGIRAALNVPLPMPVEGVSYLISWQQSGEKSLQLPPDYEEREDVRIVITKGRGLSKNRNHALCHAKGDILLFSDDDTCYQSTYFRCIKDAFFENPQADIITFQAVNESLQSIKRYPDNAFLYAQTPRGFYYSSCEIAVRNSALLPMFDERFGIGSAQLACGEEEVFLYMSHRKGLKILYCPFVIVQTRQNTTGAHFVANYKVRRSKGAVLYVMHGFFLALLRCIKFACLQKGVPFLTALKDMLYGIQYIRRGHA